MRKAGNLMWIIGCLAAALLLAGCTTPVAPLGADYGTSVRLATFNQIHDPAAGKNLSAVEGLDGDAALKNMQKYRRSFQKAVLKPVTTINIGR